MNKRIIKIAVIVLLMVLIPLIIIGVLQHFDNGDELVDVGESLTELPPAPIIPKWDEQPTKEDTNKDDRSFELDDRVKVVIRGEDYIESDNIVEELPLQVRAHSMPVTGYSFSAGFLLCPSDNITPVISSPTVGYANCRNENFKIQVQEHDALSTTVDELRYHNFDNWGLYEYQSSTHKPIERNADLVLGSGLTNWKDYFENYHTDDPTVYGNFQVVADCDEECAYGPVKYVCVYNIYDETFQASAFIVCDRDRILEVTVTGDVMSLCWSYIIEATNDAIKLIT